MASLTSLAHAPAPAPAVATTPAAVTRPAAATTLALAPAQASAPAPATAFGSATAVATALPPSPSPTRQPAAFFESINCYTCGSAEHREFITAQDDLGGTPGTFRFVRCVRCGLVYQNPRVALQHIGAYYDDQYIAHRRKRDWGPLTPLFERAMNKLDIDKERIVSRYVTLDATSEVLDVGCAVGTFLQRLRRTYGARVAGVDFKDLSSAASLRDIEFHCSLFYDAPLEDERFDLVTMWHFLEHDYDPPRSLETARRVLKPEGRLIIEVPRLDSRTFRWFGNRWPGLQAPQHTVLFDRDSLFRTLRKSGFEVIDYLPYGAFPAYFYLFTGVAFRLLQGRGLNLDRAIVPYFLGQLLASPVLLFERYLNLAMQTVICRKANAGAEAGSVRPVCRRVVDSQDDQSQGKRIVASPL